MWKCPECETLNEGERCVICDWKRPAPVMPGTTPKAPVAPGTTPPMNKTNDGLQRATRMETNPSAGRPMAPPPPSTSPWDMPGPTSNPYAAGSAASNSAYSGTGAGYTENVYGGAARNAAPAHGTPAYSEPVNAAPAFTPPAYGSERRTVSRKEFFDTYLSEKLKKGFKSNLILAYVCIILSVVVNIGIYAAFEGAYSIGMLMGVMVMLGLEFICIVGVHTNKSKGAAVSLVVLAAANSIISLAMDGNMTGWLFLAAAISLLKVINDGDKEYKTYITGAR